jgi:hypothetical protein
MPNKFEPRDVKEMQFSPNESVAFDFEAFESNIYAHGLEFIHFSAIPDPTGLLSKNDSRRPNVVDNPLASNGMLYIKRGKIQALMSGATKEVKASSGGITDSGIAQISPACFYVDPPCGKEIRVYLTPYDRLYISQENILVTRTELVNSSISGVDTLKFPVVNVLLLVDSEGNFYQKDSYSILNGRIHWTEGKPRPSFDSESNQGQVYSIKYEMTPYYYVQRLVHDLRLIQGFNDATGDRAVIQAQQSAIIAREYLIDTLQPMAQGQVTQNNIEMPTV